MDVRIITATHSDLAQKVQTNQFRQDLYYRVAVITMLTPPLRERKEDIPELVGLFISVNNQRMGANVTDVTPRAMQALMNHNWPGNIRELQNVLKRLMLLGNGEDNLDDMLMGNLQHPRPSGLPRSAGQTATVGIRPHINSLDISHIAKLDDRRSSWGVTTSGIGGRSFTRGIASAVTVIAANASIADAASTAIANVCFVRDPNIRQIPAEQIDPNTDLVGQLVTIGIGKLTRSKCEIAQNKALERAEDLVAGGDIDGALICQNKLSVMTSSLAAWVHKID